MRDWAERDVIIQKELEVAKAREFELFDCVDNVNEEYMQPWPASATTGCGAPAEHLSLDDLDLDAEAARFNPFMQEVTSLK